MEEKIPVINNLKSIYLLYNAHRKATDFIKKYKSSEYEFESRTIIPVSEMSNLESILSNSDSYINLASSLYNMKHDLIEFNKDIEETLEYLIKDIRGRFNGKTEAEMQSVSTLLGLIPIASGVGQSEGKVSGDINLGVYDFEKLVNVVPSYKQWLKDFLTQYVSEINQNLELLNEDEKEESRLKLKVDRINNAIRDCYQEEKVTLLKFASQNVLGGLKDFRESMFPISSGYENCGKKDFKDNFLGTTKSFITSLKELKEFSKDKEKISFRYSDYHCHLYAFHNETSKIKKKFLGLF